MKKLLFSFVITLTLCLLCLFSVSAADNIVYLADGGTGDGSSATSPVATAAAAYAALGDNSGVIVIVDKYTVGNTSVVTLPTHTGEVKITSVYGDADYRDSGAALHFNGTSFAAFNGPTVFDDLNMTVAGSAAGIYMNFNDLYIGHGVEILKNGVAGYYMYLIGGANNKTGAPTLAAGETFNMEIYSGKYHTMSPFSRSISNASHFGTATVTLGGDADVSAFCGGPLSTGAKGGTAIINIKDDASVTTFYLGGYGCGSMNGNITVNMSDSANVTKISNYNETYFATTTRTLNYTSTVSLPSDFSDCFDTVTQTDLVTGDLNTVYVADGGSGDGTSKTSPINSLANAFALLSENGGTIVLVGDTTVANAITLTECADDVTFCAENGAKLILSGSIALAKNTNGKAVVFDLPIEADGGVIYGGFRNVTFETNCTVTGALDFFGGPLSSSEDDADNNAVITTLPYTITVKSGTFRNFEGGICRAVYTDMVGSITAPLTVNISGGSFTDSFNLSGGSILADDVTLTVSGGAFACPIYVRSVTLSTQSKAARLSPIVASNRTYYAMDGDVAINISGGSFMGGIISAYDASVAYTQLLRGNFTVSVTGGTFAGGTVLDATQVKAYDGVEDKLATVTYSDGYDFICTRFDKVNEEVITYDEPLRIAFVGDSITEGAVASAPLTTSYPAVFASLAKAAGKDVIVANYGVSASGILPVTYVYYLERLAYPLLLEETEADYIILTGFGTNDHLAATRNGLRKEYITRYTDFIETLSELPATDKVFMTNSIVGGTKVLPGTAHFRIRSVIAPLQERIARELISKDSDKYIFIDMYGLVLPVAKAGNLLSGDRTHPKDSGYAAMGEKIYDAIFNGVLAPETDYHRTEIYLSENGTEFGSGTKEDPISRLDIALSMIPEGEEATVYISGKISHPTPIVTPLQAKKLTLVGDGNGATLEMLDEGNTIWINSDIKIDNLTLKCASSPVIIGNYHNIEFTDTTALDGTWSFFAGKCSYNAASAIIPYDTEETASSANDCTVVLNGTGSLNNFALGNYRVANVAPIGTYSGSLNATVGDGYTVSGTIVGAVGQNYLTGAITASLPYGFTCSECATIGNIASPIVYDKTKNTGKITITNREVVTCSDVVYVADGGSGDGKTPSSPLGSLADAYGKLENGGTIVICGKYTVGNTENVTLPANTSKITITSVFGGVDYRTTASATLTFNGTAFLKLSGSTVFDAITMSLDKTAAGICANFNPVTVTESVSIVQASGGTGYYMYFITGPNGDTAGTLAKGEVLEMNINGGKFINLSAFSRSVKATNEGTVILNIGGNADVRDLSAGSLSQGSYAGNSIVNLSKDAKVTTLYLGGYNSGGMKGDAVVNITDNASVEAIKNYSASFFPSGEKHLNIFSTGASLPSGYASCFDHVTTASDNANMKFVKSGATGNGASPFVPMGTIEGAYTALTNGGTVVVMDSVNFANASTLQLASHEGTIKLTSLYGGMDFRTLKGAKVGFDGTSFVCFNGDSIIDDITLNIDKASEGFCFNFNNTTVGKGFTIEEDMSAYHMLVVGGFNNMDLPALATDKEVTITIEGGRYHTVTGFTRNNTNMSHAGTVTLNIGGDALINAYCVGPIGTGAKGGNAKVNMYDSSVVNNMYLGGYNCGAMNGDVTVSIDGAAKIGKFINYDETFFPSTQKNLNILSIDSSLPANYKEVFDDITTIQSNPTAVLTLPEDAPSSDKRTHVLIDGKRGNYTVSDNDGTVTVEFESIQNEVNISLTYKDTYYRRLDYKVTIADGVATATLTGDKVYDGSVIFIADAGNGDGLTSASPLATLEEAYTYMLTDGGTIVVCGNLTMVKYSAVAHTNAITITSVYSGVDYREVGARLYYPKSSVLTLGGETIFKDITLDFDINGLISAAYNPVTFDTGVTINYDSSENDEAGLYLVGGYNTGAIPANPDYSKSSSITLRSGNFSRVFGFSRYVGTQNQSGTANITLEGDAHVRYLIAGATGNSATSNSANINISDNVIVETLYLGGLQKDNYMYGETLVDITDITGGTIYEFDGISLYAMVNGTDTIHYNPRTVPDGVLHLAKLAWVDNILTLCDVAGYHTFGIPYASPFDANMQIHTCEKCGFTTSLEEIEGSVNGVVYVADGGFGDGSSPATPLGSYADAFDALGDKGGTIVVIRECTIPKTVKYKHGSDPEFYQEPMHEGRVLVTSLHGGVDYREMGAKLIFDGTMDYRLSGPVTFDDINFDATTASAVNTIAARYYPLTFGDGVKMLKTYKADGYTLNVVGGYKYFRYTDFAGIEIEDEFLRFLNHSVSTDNVEIPDATELNIGNTVARKDAANAFNAMWAEMEEKGMQLPIVSSAYQTYEWKHDFFANFLGNTRANHPDWDYERAYTYVTKSCGEPGASEHHLGVAVDMYDNTINSDSPNHDYDTTAEWDWLVNQGGAEKYGIILRYPENTYCTAVTGFINEAWHFRYIGVEHAKAYADSGYPIFEFYVGDKIGLFAKDSSVDVQSGSFYSISGGSAECADITFTGTNKVVLGSDVTVENVTDITVTYGDATGDGEVTILDVVRLLRYCTDNTVEINKTNADTNNDGVVNIKDILLVIKAVVN
ncbi:MAG: hypothetical protein E7598_03185 [Ruminococcaceae bacterium]|nr:hypothetical protein [Oscillospiraceae bacterium]